MYFHYLCYPRVDSSPTKGNQDKQLKVNLQEPPHETTSLCVHVKIHFLRRRPIGMQHASIAVGLVHSEELKQGNLVSVLCRRCNPVLFIG